MALSFLYKVCSVTYRQQVDYLSEIINFEKLMLQAKS